MRRAVDEDAVVGVLDVVELGDEVGEGLGHAVTAFRSRAPTNSV